MLKAIFLILFPINHIIFVVYLSLTETTFVFSDQRSLDNGTVKKKSSHVPLMSRPTERKCYCIFENYIELFTTINEMFCKFASSLKSWNVLHYTLWWLVLYYVLNIMWVQECLDNIMLCVLYHDHNVQCDYHDFSWASVFLEFEEYSLLSYPIRKLCSLVPAVFSFSMQFLYGCSWFFRDR